MLTHNQAEALYPLIAGDDPADAEATLARINSTPGVAERWITERTLSADPAIGPANCAGLLLTLEEAAETLAASPELADRVQTKLMRLILDRLTGDGLDLANPLSLGMLDQLVEAMPNTAVAAFAPAIRGLVPTQASVVLGRDATLEDLAAARAAAEARVRYEQRVAADQAAYADELADALALAEGD